MSTHLSVTPIKSEPAHTRYTHPRGKFLALLEGNKLHRCVRNSEKEPRNRTSPKALREDTTRHTAIFDFFDHQLAINSLRNS